MTNSALRFGAVAVPLLASLLSSADARACGGCFHPSDQPPEQTSVVLAHRMALSISPDVSVLWDQVQYAGSPSEFAWVLPVKPGARIEVASDAWFEALDAATSVRIAPPTLQCVTTTQQVVPSYSYENYPACSSGAAVGCGMSSGHEVETDTIETSTTVTPLAPPADPVTIVHQGSAGPYETVTLHSTVPGALTDWLTGHGYAIDASIQPVVDAYEQDGFDFIALRLLPDAGVQQMKPVRVVQPGAVTTLPLRMVAAGAGPSVALTLFVIAEGRYLAGNFPEAQRPALVNWDFASQSSDYATQRQQVLSQEPSWLTAFAVPGALFTPELDPTGGYVQYRSTLGSRTTVADAFMDQALADGEAAVSCAGIYAPVAMSTDKVVDLCPPGEPCAEPAPGELDSRNFACGPVTDLAVALTGLHPRDVWVTRLEAQLPRAALSTDLELSADPTQTPVTSVIVADGYANPPCTVAAAGAMKPVTGPGPRGHRPPLAAAALLLLACAVARRLSRAPAQVRAPAPSPLG